MQFNPASPKVSFVIGLLVLALTIALATGAVKEAGAQVPQPRDDTIDIEFNESDCRVRVEWEDGQEDSVALKVSVDAVFRSTVNINDVVGDQSSVLSSFVIDEDDEEQRIVAELYGAEDQLLDREVQDVLCNPPEPTPTPTATATVTPTATSTAVPTATATSAPQAPSTSFADICRALKGELVGGICITEPAPSPATVAPAQQVVQQPATKQCANGSIVAATSSCPISAPNTGDGGLVD